MKNRIQELRREQNLTLDALSEQIGVSQETIRAYEAGIQDPPPEILIKLAQKLNASIDYIFCQSASRQADSPSRFTNEELRLLDMFRQFDPSQRSLILDYLKSLTDSDDEA